MHRGKKNEGGSLENKDKALEGEKENKNRKTKRLEYAQRQRKKGVVGSQMKDAWYRKAEQKKIGR